jgi:hypothetical protein
MEAKAIPVALALLLGACATVHESAVPRMSRSPVELRQAQSRTFEAVDARLVLKAALNVLQDEGYTIREVSSELGLVTGVMEWRSRQANQALKVLKWIAAPMTYGASLLIPSGKTEFSTVEASMNVTQEAGRTRVRVGLVSRVTDKDRSMLSVTPIDDPVAYQGLLALLDKAVYLQKEGL